MELQKQTFPYQFPFARYPALRIALALALGISVANWLDPNLWLILLLLALVGGLYLFSQSRYRQTLSSGWYTAVIVCYLAVLGLFGASRWGFQQYNRADQTANELNRFYRWESLDVSGSVRAVRQNYEGRLYVDLAIDSVQIGQSRSSIAAGMRIISDSSFSVVSGDYLRAVVTLYPLSEPTNPNQFNYKAYLKTRDIALQAGLDTLLQIRTDKRTVFGSINRAIQDRIELLFTQETAPLAKALLLGEKGELDPGQKVNFSRSGLSHIMAVSGLHVGFFVAPFWLLIPWCWQFRSGKILGIVVLSLALYGYAGVTGFSPSVVRASLMALLLAYAKLWHKPSDALNLMGVAAIIILLVKPAQLFEVGFQLSFGAVGIILLVTPVLNRTLPLWINYRWYGIPISIIAVSLVVQAGLFPILTYYFTEFSLIGPLANALILPFLGFAIGFAVLALITGSVSMTIGSLLVLPAHYFFEGLILISSALSRVDGGWITYSHQTVTLFLIWISATGVAASLYRPQLRWKWLITLLIVLISVTGLTIYRKLQTRPLTVTFLDVGQGDAAHLQTPGGKHLLIDAGRWSPGYDSGKYVILPYLKKLGVDTLDAIVLTHPHADHIGGIKSLIEGIPIGTIYNSGFPYESNLYETYLEMARSRNIPVRSVKAGDELPIDPSILLLAYGPSEIEPDGDPNEYSVVLEVIYDEIEILFTGDAGLEQEARLITHFGDLLDTDLLKVGHHGSSTSSGTSFLRELTPTRAVVSLGWKNRYRHPHRVTINRLSHYSDTLLFTSLEGAIRFRSDGKEIERVSWR